MEKAGAARPTFLVTAAASVNLRTCVTAATRVRSFVLSRNFVSDARETSTTFEHISFVPRRGRVNFTKLETQKAQSRHDSHELSYKDITFAIDVKEADMCNTAGYIKRDAARKVGNGEERRDSVFHTSRRKSGYSGQEDARVQRENTPQGETSCTLVT